MRIACICCTYKRPVELANMIACFEAQDYDDKKLVIVDDAGQYPSKISGKDWLLVSYRQRFRTIGEKRNESARLAREFDPVILAPWDDDDIYLPWHLSALARAIKGKENSVSIPSEIWIDRLNRPFERYTENRQKRSFHAAWGFHLSLFENVGGYPAIQSGQDQVLLAKFSRHGYEQVDPIQYDPRPSFVYRCGTVVNGYNLSSGGGGNQSHFDKLGEIRAEFQESLIPKFERDWVARYEQAIEREPPFLRGDDPNRLAMQEQLLFRMRYPLTDRDLQISDGAALFIVDDEGLLFSAARGEVCHLNTAATYVWCALEDGASWEELLAGLSDFCGMTAADAENTLEYLAMRWRRQGVLLDNEADSEEKELAPSRDDLPEIADKDAIAFPVHATIQREQYYRVLDCHLCVQFCVDEQIEWLMPVLTHFEVIGDRAPDSVITVYAVGHKHHIFQDGQLVHADKLISELAPFLKFQLVRTALESFDHIMNLHAGVVSKNGALIAMPAQSGGGKSTLVAGLIKRGYQYFSDELAPLARSRCEVIPVPLGICIKDTAFDILRGLYPEIPRQPIHDRADGRRAVYLPPPAEAIAANDEIGQITHIVSPRYQAGSATTLKSVSRLEGFARAMQQCVSIPKPLTMEDAAALVRWIEQVQCYELVSGSLEEMMDQIDGLLPPGIE